MDPEDDRVRILQLKQENQVLKSLVVQQEKAMEIILEKFKTQTVDGIDVGTH